MIVIGQPFTTFSLHISPTLPIFFSRFTTLCTKTGQKGGCMLHFRGMSNHLIETSDIKVLLIQLRNGDLQRHEQYECYVRMTGLRKDQVEWHDALLEEVDPTMADGFDAVIIGGSECCNVSRGEPRNNLDALVSLVKHCEKMGIPLLGICYGAHLIAHALGGVVEYKPNQKELGTYPIHVLEPGKDDVLFSQMPEHFPANIGRTDDIIELPITAVPLANSDKIQYHAFTIAGKPIYGLQFHPELNREDMLDRFSTAHDFGGYFDSDEEYAERCASVEDTPESATILQRFLSDVVVPHSLMNR